MPIVAGSLEKHDAGELKYGEPYYSLRPKQCWEIEALLGAVEAFVRGQGVVVRECIQAEFDDGVEIQLKISPDATKGGHLEPFSPGSLALEEFVSSMFGVIRGQAYGTSCPEFLPTTWDRLEEN